MKLRVLLGERLWQLRKLPLGLCNAPCTFQYIPVLHNGYKFNYVISLSRVPSKKIQLIQKKDKDSVRRQ